MNIFHQITSRFLDGCDIYVEQNDILLFSMSSGENNQGTIKLAIGERSKL